MSFFQSLKRAFGFNDSDIDDEDDVIGIDATVRPIITPASIANGTAARPASLPENAPEAAPAADDTEPILPAEMPSKIFHGVVEVFNETMPAFVKAGLDVEAQSDYLFQRLEVSIQEFLKSLEDRANTRCEARWRADRDKLLAEMSTLQDKLHRTEDNTADSKKMQLSAERQKRALSDRVHDLEKQLAQLEAENEQYDLENKSLVNKLRLAQFQSGDGSMPLPEATSEADAQRIAELQAEIEKLQTALDQMKVKAEMSDAMINELNAKTSESIRQTEADAERLEASAKELEDATLRAALAEEQLADLREKLRLASDELQASQEELEESRQSLEVVQEIQEQLATLEQMQAKKDAKIKSLTDDLRHRDDSLRQLEDLNDSLRKTIENNLYAQAQSESILKQEIDSLRSQLGNRQSSEPAKKKERKAPRISAIDESLEDTDWLIATPPEGKSTSLRSETDDSFGYHEPERRKPTDDSAQMRLWD